MATLTQSNLKVTDIEYRIQQLINSGMTTKSEVKTAIKPWLIGEGLSENEAEILSNNLDSYSNYHDLVG